MSDQFRPMRFEVLPLVVKNLLIINGLLYLATVVFEHQQIADLTSIFGLYYHGSDKFHFYQFFTYLFMHGGFMHLFFNMFAFWMFGNVLENVWGAKRFLIFYLATGIGAAIVHQGYLTYEFYSLAQDVEQLRLSPSAEQFHQLVDSHFPAYVQAPEIQNLVMQWMTNENPVYLTQAMDYITELTQYKLEVPTVGASGSVYGVLLAFGMLFPNTWLYIYFAIPIKAKYFVILYGAMELYSAFQNNPNDNVAHIAHLGGMLFGFILIKMWSRNRNHFY